MGLRRRARETRGRLGRLPAPIAAAEVAKEARRLPAPSGSAVARSSRAWVPCAGHSTPARRWAGGPVAVHGLREGDNRFNAQVCCSSRTPRTALLQSRSARGSAGATGGREPVGSACTVMLIRCLASVWKRGGSRRAGRPAGRRFGQLLNFPHAVNRNRAPAHLRSRVEWPAHGTQPSPRQSTALPDGAGRRRASYPTSTAAMGAARRPSQPRYDFKVAITSEAIFRAAAVSVPGTLMAPTTGWPPPP